MADIAKIWALVDLSFKEGECLPIALYKPLLEAHLWLLCNSKEEVLEVCEVIVR